MIELLNDLAQVRWWVWAVLFGGMFFLILAWAMVAIGARADEQMRRMMDEAHKHFEEDV